MLKKILILSILVVLGLTLITALVLYKSELTRNDLSEYMTPESKFITLANGANVHYRAEGNENGPTLLLFHGGFGSLHNWEGWVPYLKKHFYLISLDLPAHGLTGRIPGDVYTRETMIETSQLLMENLNISRFSIAGNSMGGGLALQYALDKPENVNALILIASEGIPNSENGYDASMFSDQDLKAPGDNGYNTLSTIENFLSKFIGPTVIRSVLEELVSNKNLITDEFVSWYGRIIRHEGNRYANILMFRQWMPPGAHPRDLESQLHSIHVPVLYMHGEDDHLVPLSVAKRFKELLPNSTLIQYPKTGHMAMIERPEQTAMDVLNFFKEKKLLQASSN